MVEAQMEDFIRSEALTTEEVYEACRRVKEGSDSAWITCVDYLLAATEYTSFIGLVADFQGLEQWETADGNGEPLENFDYGITV